MTQQEINKRIEDEARKYVLGIEAKISHYDTFIRGAQLLAPELQHLREEMKFKSFNEKRLIDECNSCIAEIEQHKSQIEKSQKEADDYRKNLIVFKTSFENGIEKNNELKSHIEELKKEIIDKNVTLVKCYDKLGEQAAEIESLNQQIGQVKESLLFANDEIESLKQENERLKEEWIPKSIAFKIADKFYGSDYPMNYSQFESALNYFSE